MESRTLRVVQMLDSLGPVPARPVALSARYLAQVAEIEGLPENQDGSDKTWIFKAISQYRQFFERAVPQ